MSNRQVILLGVDSPIGLTVIRELGQSGISVHGMGWGKRSIGLYSRYLTSAHIRKRSEEELVTQINEISERFGCRWLMTVGELDIMLVNKIKHLLKVTAIVPGAEQIQLVVNKQAVLDIAETVGIATPRTWQISDHNELDNICQNLQYPLVLKWDNPLEVSSALRQCNLPLDKFKYVYNEGELLDYMGRFRPVAKYPLIQEYCKGYGLGQMVLMDQGEVYLRFQHRRLAEWPPEGGFSVVSESVGLEQHQALMEKTVSLLKAIKWSGPAMVEYRYDPETDRAVLMEINGRFWGSLPLAYYSGAHFALGFYMLVAENRTIDHECYKSGIRCRFVFPEIKRLFRILFFQDKIQNKSLRFSRFGEAVNFLFRYLSFDTRYYVFSPADPKPFFADLWMMLSEAMSGNKV